MATTSIGNLNVRLTLSADQFASAMQTAGGDVRIFAQNVRAQADATQAASSGLFTMGSRAQHLGLLLPALAQGAADFSSQLGTRGLGGALQAAANNIQVMGAAFGPAGLAISSTIGLGVQLVGAYIESQDRLAKKSKETADKTVSDTSRQREALMELRTELDRIRQQAELQAELAAGFGGASAKQLRERAAGLEPQLAGAEAQRLELGRNVQDFLGIGIGRGARVVDAQQVATAMQAASENGTTLREELAKIGVVLKPDEIEKFSELAKEMQTVQARIVAIRTERDALNRAAGNADVREQMDGEAEAAEREVQEITKLREQFLQTFDAGVVARTKDSLRGIGRMSLPRREDMREEAAADRSLFEQARQQPGVATQEELDRAAESLRLREQALGVVQQTELTASSVVAKVQEAAQQVQPLADRPPAVDPLRPFEAIDANVRVEIPQQNAIQDNTAQIAEQSRRAAEALGWIKKSTQKQERPNIIERF